MARRSLIKEASACSHQAQEEVNAASEVDM